MAAATSYSSSNVPMIPFFIYYSMFGFQRVGDHAWPAGDIGARGFMLGATAGRTTLNGEGLQHEDGHSLILASTVPNVAAYDPAFAYEVAEIIQDGIARMYGPEDNDEFFYVTLYNENYVMPAKPDGIEDGIRRGLYRFAAAPVGPSRSATILFSGSASQAAIAARDALATDFDVAAELWSATSYKTLREEALAVERSNRLHPSRPAEVPYVATALSDAEGPIVAVTDFMKAVPDQISRWVPRTYLTLGTDGFGRSDTREALRRHFEVDAGHIVVAVLSALAASGAAGPEEVEKAIDRYEINADAPDPRTA
jgi:pyruvate dehydrogenase E1 component